MVPKKRRTQQLSKKVWTQSSGDVTDAGDAQDAVHGSGELQMQGTNVGDARDARDAGHVKMIGRFGQLRWLLLGAAKKRMQTLFRKLKMLVPGMERMLEMPRMLELTTSRDADDAENARDVAGEC